jgi:uncharacterized protein YqiB (DUF1249 family)
MDLFHQNFQKLLRLLPESHNMAGPTKLVVAGRSDVNVDGLERHAHRLVLRLSRYLDRLHGAAIPDPDMTLEIYLLAETVGALTYRDSSVHGTFSVLN